MQPFRTILFAADYPHHAKEVFHLACSLATEGKTRLIVAHVIEPNWVAEEPVYFGHASVQFHNAGQKPGRVEAIREGLRALYAPNHPIDVEYRVEEGEAAAEILRLAAEVGADLIVMGTHGRRGLNWLLAGSVATEVLRKAPCPTLAWRAPAASHETGAIRVILHPTDFSHNSEGARVVARSLARDLGARLIILHVAEVQVVMEGAMVAEIDPSSYRDALEDVCNHLDGPDLKYPVETRLSRGFVEEEILQVAGEVGCDLIVMGTHGRTGLGRLLMGSVAESVLPRANCPVLVMKDHREVPSPRADRPTNQAVTVL
jgi:nucleotide-binding universal stress UspA family protein